MAPPALSHAAPKLPVFSSSATLGPEKVWPKLSTGPEYQFPDAALAFLSAPQSASKFMFPSDGKTYRTSGPDLFHQGKPDPPGPVLGAGVNGSFDMNGNWMLAVFQVGGPSSPRVFSYQDYHMLSFPS